MIEILDGLKEAFRLVLGFDAELWEISLRSLLPTSSAPKPATRLNPIFDFEDQPVVMVTQFMAAVPTAILKISVGKLDEEFEKVTSAIDMLIQGF